MDLSNFKPITIRYDTIAQFYVDYHLSTFIRYAVDRILFYSILMKLDHAYTNLFWSNSMTARTKRSHTAVQKAESCALGGTRQNTGLHVSSILNFLLSTAVRRKPAWLWQLQ